MCNNNMDIASGSGEAAANRSPASCVEYLTIDKFWTLLHSASIHNGFDIAKLLINIGFDVNAKDKMGRTPIHYAIRMIDPYMTKILLKGGANTDNYPELIHNAIKAQSREIVEILLQHNTKIVNFVDKHGRTALHHVALNRSYYYFSLLFPRRFRRMSAEDRAEIAKLLLRCGANINAKTHNGLTALHTAAESGSTEILEILLEHNADVNAQTNCESTALHCAAYKGYYDIVEILLNNGADINARQRDGTTALHVASEKGDVRVVEMLLDYGADIDAKDRYDKTALHTASIRARKSVILVLLDNGADVNIVCEDNSTALDYCKLPQSFFTIYTEEFTRSLIYQLTNSRDFDDYDEAVDIVERHTIKLEALGCFISEQNLAVIDVRDKHSMFYYLCNEELRHIKQHRISDSKISYYDILMGSTDQVAVYAANENVEEALESDEYKEMFPIFSSMINCQFAKGQKRKELLKAATKSFNFFVGYQMPNILSTQILTQLSNEELKNLIRAWLKAS